MRQRQGSYGFFIPLWLVWLTAICFVLAGLGSSGILDNNEGLYAEIPREMLASGDWRQWVIPHLNGLPYMEKPPLLYWLTALSFSLFGESEWSARAVPALSSLACVAMLVRFGTAVQRPQAGRLAAIIFVSGVGVTAMSRVLMFDMLLTALLTGALMFAWLHLAQNRTAALRWSYGLLALALLAKGFVAMVLYGLVIVGFLLVSGRSVGGMVRALGRLFEPGALLVFLAIAVPWHLAASLTEPIFAWFYFINEHVLRFLGQREPHDYYGGPWWYYLPRMAIYLFPWSFLLVPILLQRRAGTASADTEFAAADGNPANSLAAFDASIPLNADGKGKQFRRFLLLAWLAPLCFFSVSSAKANYYLVAVMPFAALHLAIALEGRGPGRPWQRGLPGILIGVLAGLVCIALSLRADEAGPAFTVAGLGQREFLLWVAAGLASISFGTAILAWRRPGVGVLAYLFLPAWTGVALWMVLMAMEPLASTRPVARFLQSEHAARQVYLYRVFEQKSSLPFYLGKPVPVVNPRSNDLFWGDRLRKNEIMITSAQFDQVLAANPSVAIVVQERDFAEFKALPFAPRFTASRRFGDTHVFMN